MNRATRIVMLLVVLVIFAVGFGNAVMYLWNWLMPELFGLKRISYGQALGLLGLSWILFGGWRGPGLWGPRHRMSPEERDRFRKGLEARFGNKPAGPSPSPNQA